MRLDAFLTSPGFEEALIEELGRPAGPRWPAVVTRAPAPGPVDPVFARQALPDAALVKGESVRALAEGALAVVLPRLEADPGAFTVQAFVPDRAPYRTIEGRARLVGEAFLAALQGRRRALARRHRAEPTGWPDLQLVQLAVVARTTVLASCARPRPLPRGGVDLAPWPAGLAPVAEDRAAPSRAYGKLEEGLAWLGEAPGPGELCVDLGGAPGGWAWKALARGARVVAVDRAPLAPPAAGHPRLATVIGDAFRYEPPAPADWLLCDVICEPARTLALVERWMARGLCRRVVATVKFKGRGGYGILRGVPERLAAHGFSFVRLKHLARHHNEVAVLARR